MSNEPKVALHAVSVRRQPRGGSSPVDVEEAKRIADGILQNKRNRLVRHRKSTYHIRHISRQKFLPKTLKTKRIDNTTSLTYGELKPEFHHLEGRGFLDYFKKKASDVGNALTNAKNKVVEKVQSAKEKVSNYFSPRLDDFNNKSKKNIQQYGDITIQSMQIYRTPIQGFIEPVLNAVSLGKWNTLKKKYAFDKLFHLALVCNVGGKNVMCQKNSTVDITTTYKTKKDTETLQLNLQGKQFTIKDMLDKARDNVGDKRFFEYDAFKNNCQYFISYLLQAEQLYSTEADQFLFQDISGIVKELPEYVQKFARGLTDLDATINKVSGQGHKKKKSRNKRVNTSTQTSSVQS